MREREREKRIHLGSKLLLRQVLLKMELSFLIVIFQVFLLFFL